MEELLAILQELDYSPLVISLKTGVVAAVLAFFTSVLLANALMRTSSRLADVIDSLLTLPMVLPPTVSGFLLLMIFSRRRPVGMLLYEQLGIQVVQSWLADLRTRMGRKSGDAGELGPKATEGGAADE